MATIGLPTASAFLMRTSMSAMGSVMLIEYFLCKHRYPQYVCEKRSARDAPGVWPRRGAAGDGLPARLAQARHVAAHGRFAQLVPAQAELGVHAARAAGQLAAVAHAARRGIARQLLQLLGGGDLVLVRGGGAGDDLLQLGALAGMPLHKLLALDVAVDHGGLGHGARSWKSVAEREAEGLEQRLGFLVGLGGGRDRDVHAAHGVDLVEIDLREDDLFLDAHVVVAAAVERAAGDAAEVADARQRDVDQAVEELVHLGPAQGHLAADRPAVADPEARHRD